MVGSGWDSLIEQWCERRHLQDSGRRKVLHDHVRPGKLLYIDRTGNLGCPYQ